MKIKELNGEGQEYEFKGAIQIRNMGFPDAWIPERHLSQIIYDYFEQKKIEGKGLHVPVENIK